MASLSTTEITNVNAITQVLLELAANLELDGDGAKLRMPIQQIGLALPTCLLLQVLSLLFLLLLVMSLLFLLLLFVASYQWDKNLYLSSLSIKELGSNLVWLHLNGCPTVRPNS